MRGSYAELAAIRDQKVDAFLGDDVLLSSDAGAHYTPVKAFVLTEHGGAGLGALDELQQRFMLKIAKALMPEPDFTVRVRCATILGDDTYQPAGEFQTAGGGYWLCDLQKVRTP